MDCGCETSRHGHTVGDHRRMIGQPCIGFRLLHSIELIAIESIKCPANAVLTVESSEP
jgi:hypothetical protein